MALNEGPEVLAPCVLLGQKPDYDASGLQMGMGLRALSKDLLHIEVLRQADWWAGRSMWWCDFWVDFLERKGVVEGARGLYARASTQGVPRPRLTTRRRCAVHVPRLLLDRRRATAGDQQRCPLVVLHARRVFEEQGGGICRQTSTSSF